MMVIGLIGSLDAYGTTVAVDTPTATEASATPQQTITGTVTDPDDAPLPERRKLRRNAGLVVDLHRQISNPHGGRSLSTYKYIRLTRGRPGSNSGAIHIRWG
jgi:hypothetical protein